ncbi:hypothetical protein EKI60_06465 [Candidatus Saccharibacteria bacterium]|nr:MAG: hypothetical protein EKI60_06465 [Candidatus Saccharibacteria bacterium]
MSLSDKAYVAGLKSNIHATFDSPQGKEVMKFLEKISGWTPSILDSNETNDIIARDANRKLIGTIKTILDLSVDQIVELAGKEE